MVQRRGLKAGVWRRPGYLSMEANSTAQVVLWQARMWDARRSLTIICGGCRDAGGTHHCRSADDADLPENADIYLPVRPGNRLSFVPWFAYVFCRDGLERRDFISVLRRLRTSCRNRLAPADPRTVCGKDGSGHRSTSSATHALCDGRTCHRPSCAAVSSTNQKGTFLISGRGVQIPGIRRRYPDASHMNLYACNARDLIAASDIFQDPLVVCSARRASCSGCKTQWTPHGQVGR